MSFGKRQRYFSFSFFQLSPSLKEAATVLTNEHPHDFCGHYCSKNLSIAKFSSPSCLRLTLHLISPSATFLKLISFPILISHSNYTVYKQQRCHKSSAPRQEHCPPGKAGLSQESCVRYCTSFTDWNKTMGPDGQDLLDNLVTVAPSVSKGSLLPHR